MYNVSPNPKPIIPLTHARTIAYAGKLAKIRILPITARHAIKIIVALARRTMLAEMGFDFTKAFLYSIAEIVQQIAAPKAASSPIIISRSFLRFCGMICSGMLNV
jgi:hypothetical protein